ncbi:suppressor APC domain-containing protein 1 isoform X9 [Alligator mississippiensis]|uniref:suppressor APC domain-containing protein 1 isoform X9 n=1 Tax=Alligator mississippiensis TaxID=8496 RepID=UPI002877FF9F|nr:suppressor APC domain-containing protein 1 isoform X9 [Alligator mississippiensis]
MAARGYTVLILPLGSALGSWDALRGFLRLRRLQGLERERDALLQGLELAERLRAWCQRHLQAAQRRRRHAQRAGADYLGDSGSDHSCLLLAKIQEVNQCLEKLFAGARKHPPMLPPGPGPGPPCPTVEEAGVSAANAVGAARAEPLAHQGGVGQERAHRTAGAGEGIAGPAAPGDPGRPQHSPQGAHVPLRSLPA